MNTLTVFFGNKKKNLDNEYNNIIKQFILNGGREASSPTDDNIDCIVLSGVEKFPDIKYDEDRVYVIIDYIIEWNEDKNKLDKPEDSKYRIYPEDKSKYIFNELNFKIYGIDHSENEQLVKDNGGTVISGQKLHDDTIIVMNYGCLESTWFNYLNFKHTHKVVTVEFLTNAIDTGILDYKSYQFNMNEKEYFGFFYGCQFFTSTYFKLNDEIKELIKENNRSGCFSKSIDDATHLVTTKDELYDYINSTEKNKKRKLEQFKHITFVTSHYIKLCVKHGRVFNTTDPKIKSNYSKYIIKLN